MKAYVVEPDRLERDLPDKKPEMSEYEARAEAERCLYCSDAPCIQACPTEIDIPTFIKKISSQNLRGSARTIFDQNILGYSCSRVCPVEVLCEGSCVYNGLSKKPIAIGRLQRYATKHATRDLSVPFFAPKPSTGRKVALIGAGPASLACAAYLRLNGHAATIFEKRSLPGGLNTTGVAPYKLHAEDALREVAWIESLGVEIRCGVEVGKDVRGAELLRDFDGVFLGIGLGDDSHLHIPGEEGPGVVGAVAWIEQMKLKRRSPSPLGRVIVVGGGNTAIDVARECAQLGASEVSMVYRRGAEAMTGYAHELDGAKHDSVRLVLNTQPVAVVRDASGAVTALRVARASAGKPVPGTERDLACDRVILAIGQAKLSGLAQEFPGVLLDDKGRIVADAKTGRTGNPKVFAGGDAVNGGKEVVNGAAEGRNAARALHETWAKG